MVIFPSKPQVLHIGANGLHRKDDEGAKLNSDLVRAFYGVKIKRKDQMRSIVPEEPHEGFGGWGHPADHDHCYKVLATGDATRKGFLSWFSRTTPMKL